MVLLALSYTADADVGADADADVDSQDQGTYHHAWRAPGKADVACTELCC